MNPYLSALGRFAHFALLVVAIGGAAYGGYAYGHSEGLQDADTAAMQSFMDKCVQPEPPAMCDRMLDAVWGQNYTEGSP